LASEAGTSNRQSPSGYREERVCSQRRAGYAAEGCAAVRAPRDHQQNSGSSRLAWHWVVTP
jgi:hypothetical protein